MATREELPQLIDGMPDEALPFIQETLKRGTPQRSAEAARLIAHLSEGYDFGPGERPYGKRHGLYDRGVYRFQCPRIRTQSLPPRRAGPSDLPD